jgi:3-dehydroquinate synthase
MGLAAGTKLTVAVTPPYPVWVGTELVAELGAVVEESRVAVIADSNAYSHHGAVLTRALTDKRVSVFRMAGERNKNLTTYSELLSACMKAGLDRKSAIVAFGGGVVGDLAGFVAATYMRGIALYQVPTSLLAMVDSSIGGKTGVNLPEGKNMVGAFWQPKAVIMSTEVLASLPEQVFREGAVELFKHGLLADPAILTAMAQPRFGTDGDMALLQDCITRSVKVKADIVAADEREGGIRAHLNLGHTLAHALEAVTDHALSHGDAVAYGLLFAAYLGKMRGLADETARILDFIAWFKPRPLPKLEFGTLLPYIKRDKKHEGDTMRFILLRTIGDAVIVDDISQDELRQAWNDLCEAV